jgi:hypothetical protein
MASSPVWAIDLPMEIDASGKVKDPFGRGCDEGRQVDGWHFLINRCWIMDRVLHHRKNRSNLGRAGIS